MPFQDCIEAVGKKLCPANIFSKTSSVATLVKVSRMAAMAKALPDRVPLIPIGSDTLLRPKEALMRSATSLGETVHRNRDAAGNRLAERNEVRLQTVSLGVAAIAVGEGMGFVEHKVGAVLGAELA